MTLIPIGIVGLNFGAYVIEHELLDGPGKDFFRVAAVCDVDAARAQEMGVRLGCPAYSDLAALLADEALSAIGLFTGPNGRANLIRQAVHAGKHVLTTKPFERDPQAAQAILREAQALGRVVQLNSPAPCLSPDLRAIQRWRADYDLGRVIACRADTWVAYREEADGRWYDDPTLCPVAPVYRIGIYLINDLVRLLGAAEAVSVMQSRIFTGRPTPDNAQVGIRFADGVLATIFASFCIDDGDRYRDGLILNCERGTIYRNCGPARTTDAAHKTELALVMRQGDQRAVVTSERFTATSEEYQWEVFAQANRGDRAQVDVTSAQVVMGMQIVEAMAEAARTGALTAIAPLR